MISDIGDTTVVKLLKDVQVKMEVILKWQATRSSVVNKRRNNRVQMKII